MLFDYQVTSSNFRISQNSKQFYNKISFVKDQIRMLTNAFKNYNNVEKIIKIFSNIFNIFNILFFTSVFSFL